MLEVMRPLLDLDRLRISHVLLCSKFKIQTYLEPECSLTSIQDLKIADRDAWIYLHSPLALGARHERSDMMPSVCLIDDGEKSDCEHQA